MNSRSLAQVFNRARSKRRHLICVQAFHIDVRLQILDTGEGPALPAEGINEGQKVPLVNEHLSPFGVEPEIMPVRRHSFNAVVTPVDIYGIVPLPINITAHNPHIAAAMHKVESISNPGKDPAFGRTQVDLSDNHIPYICHIQR